MIFISILIIAIPLIIVLHKLPNVTLITDERAEEIKAEQDNLIVNRLVLIHKIGIIGDTQLAITNARKEKQAESNKNIIRIHCADR